MTNEHITYSQQPAWTRLRNDSWIILGSTDIDVSLAGSAYPYLNERLGWLGRLSVAQYLHITVVGFSNRKHSAATRGDLLAATLDLCLSQC